MGSERTAAAGILDVLAAAGVSTVFGLPGVHNLAFWEALAPGRPRIVGVRHEQTTVYAAAARQPFAEQTTDWLIPPPFDAKPTGSDHGSRLR